MAELAYAEVSKTFVPKTCGFDPRCSHYFESSCFDIKYGDFLFVLFGSRYSGSYYVHYSSQAEVDAGVFFGFAAF